MARPTGIAILAALALAAWAAPAGAQGELILYDGNRATALGGLELGRWGSGAAEPTTDVTYVGPEVIKLSTHGFYSGGVLRFTRSLDLAAYVGQPNAYLEFLVRPHFSKTVSEAPKPGTTPGAATPPAPTQPLVIPRSTRGEDEEYEEEQSPTTGPSPGLPAPQPTTTVTTPSLLADRFRLVAKTDQGYAVLPSWPVIPATKDERGWTRVTFPLAGFKGDLGARIDSLAIFANKPDILYIGRILARLDTTPMQAVASAYPPQGYVGEKFVFIATVTPGLADPEVRWDFNMDFLMAPDDPNYAREFDSKFKVSTTGPRVTNIFTQPGSFTVGYMVVDKGGAKPPVRRTLTVTVKEKTATTKPEASPAY